MVRNRKRLKEQVLVDAYVNHFLETQKKVGQRTVRSVCLCFFVVFPLIVLNDAYVDHFLETEKKVSQRTVRSVCLCFLLFFHKDFNALLASI